MKKVFLSLFLLIPVLCFADPLSSGTIELWGVKPYNLEQGQYEVTIINTYTPPPGSSTENHQNEFLSDGSIIPIDLKKIPTGGNDSSEGHVDLFTVEVRGKGVPEGEEASLKITVRPFENIADPSDLVPTHFVGSYDYASTSGYTVENIVINGGVTGNKIAGATWNESGFQTNRDNDSGQDAPVDYVYKAKVQFNRLNSDEPSANAVYAMRIDVALVVETDA